MSISIKFLTLAMALIENGGISVRGVKVLAIMALFLLVIYLVDKFPAKGK